MFWKVAGFSQPSPIDQILDKDEYTLEELLDEDDLIQECKSLNGRLVAFLRERSTVEQLVRFLVEPAADGDDPKRAYKYPFTSCEVFCCEVEAVFNTLLEDAELMQLLFSLLDTPAPLSSKTAGYFGRVVGTLLLRKTNEMMQYLQEHSAVLDALVSHVGTTSIADIIKRIVGADDQSILFLPQYAQWLADTRLVDLLLSRLAEPNSDAQANAADILSGIAHTQPSPLASKLTADSCIGQLFQHAMTPGTHVLVPALDVCIALIEPRRSMQNMEDSAQHEAVQRAKAEAVSAIVQHLPKLAEVLKTSEDTPAATQQTPCGLLAPRLGRARLRVVQLLAVLLRSDVAAAEAAVCATDAVAMCLDLFARYPFNNMLHSHVVSFLAAILHKSSPLMLQHLFSDCKLVDWLTTLPVEVTPVPVPGQEEASANKPQLRAGYMGHVTQIASTIDSLAAQASTSSASDSPSSDSKSLLSSFLDQQPAWQTYVDEVLRPRQDLENTARWACGRPTATDLNGMDSDNDEFQAEMELEQIVGMQPALYHRYNVDEQDEAEEEEEDEDDESDYKPAMGTPMLDEAISNIDLSDNNPWHGPDSYRQLQESELDDEAGKENSPGVQGMDTNDAVQDMDDDVLLATSDEDTEQLEDVQPEGVLSRPPMPPDSQAAITGGQLDTSNLSDVLDLGQVPSTAVPDEPSDVQSALQPAQPSPNHAAHVPAESAVEGSAAQPAEAAEAQASSAISGGSDAVDAVAAEALYAKPEPEAHPPPVAATARAHEPGLSEVATA